MHSSPDSLVSSVGSATPKPTSPPGTEGRGWVIAFCLGVVLGILVGAWQIVRRATESLPGLTLDIGLPTPISSPEPGYRLQRIIKLPNPATVTLAVGTEDQIFVACENELLVLNPDGTLRQKEPLKNRPEAFCIAPNFHRYPGRIYIASLDRVDVCEPNGQHLYTWQFQLEPLSLAAIAAGQETIYLLDAAEGRVLRIGMEGQLLGTFAGRDHQRNWPGLILPSGRAGIAVAQDGTVFVTNPGLRRIEVYSADGQFQYFWGKEGSEVDSFFGCCNPERIALLPDTRVVTAEKGIFRIKIHSAFGDFLNLVAGSRELAPLQVPTTMADSLADAVHIEVAVSREEDVLVLAPGKPLIQVFSPISDLPEGETQAPSTSPPSG